MTTLEAVAIIVLVIAANFICYYIGYHDGTIDVLDDVSKMIEDSFDEVIEKIEDEKGNNDESSPM